MKEALEEKLEKQLLKYKEIKTQKEAELIRDMEPQHTHLQNLSQQKHAEEAALEQL
jgi:hypothetical protein